MAEMYTDHKPFGIEFFKYVFIVRLCQFLSNFIQLIFSEIWGNFDVDANFYNPNPSFVPLIDTREFKYSNNANLKIMQSLKVHFQIHFHIQTLSIFIKMDAINLVKFEVTLVMIQTCTILIQVL